ncbi:MAG: ComF family protein [Lachnospiraceae bacterium]|nr:ComF family protein [Lachnospiraceae bacterium]
MNILQLLFPLRCPVCDDIVRPYGAKICVPCREKLKLLTPPWCMQCGKKLYTDGYLCQDCQRKKHKYLRGRALYEYESAAPAIYRFKYGKRQEYADFFGEEIARFLGNFIRQCNPDGLIPVPLHAKRMRHRGYNQAQLLAESMGRYLDISVYANLIKRVKNTRPLKHQNAAERENNLKKAFNIAQNDVKLDTVIIVDDIYTTGSTMDEVADVLRQHGVKKIYFIALACGKGL